MLFRRWFTKTPPPPPTRVGLSEADFVRLGEFVVKALEATVTTILEERIEREVRGRVETAIYDEGGHILLTKLREELSDRISAEVRIVVKDGDA